MKKSFFSDGDDNSICGCRNSQTMSKENAPSISVVAHIKKRFHFEKRRKRRESFNLHLFLSLSVVLTFFFSFFVKL